MKHVPWVVLLLTLSCSKSDSKDEKKQQPDKPVEKQVEKTAPAGAFAGFYAVDSVTMADGKKIDLAEAYAASFKGDGDQKVQAFRMTFEFAVDKLTVGIEQILGSKGESTYCTVHASTELQVDNGKFTTPTIEGVGSAGLVQAAGGKTDTDTTKCNVSLKKGTYEVKGGGKTVDLVGSSDGETVTLHLVAADKDFDIKNKTKKFAEAK